eukprot:gene5709-6409_t
MISTETERELLTKDAGNNLHEKATLKEHGLEALGRTQNKNKENLRVNENGRQQGNGSACFRDDGYLSLDNSKDKIKTCSSSSPNHHLLTPVNSWPLRRKITERELKEFGEKLGSGSSALLEDLSKSTSSRHGEGRNSTNYSLSSQSGTTLLIEHDAGTNTAPSAFDYDDNSLEQCIDYCTCMRTEQRLLVAMDIIGTCHVFYALFDVSPSSKRMFGQAQVPEK